MPHFSNEINNACIVLDSENADRVYFDENEFIDASRLVYDGVREVRRAVLTNRVRASPMPSSYSFKPRLYPEIVFYTPKSTPYVHHMTSQPQHLSL